MQPTTRQPAEKHAQNRTRREQVNIRFDAAEQAEARSLAKRYGVSFSGLVRLALHFLRDHGPLS
jgi:antitoxin component of RelBE/YafQ-DinJ toxin-antitoxin module